jgi:hypothetical protein
MWFPLAIHEASSLGGGLSLLGSVVEELSSGIFGWGDRYPAPYHMTTPRLVLSALSRNRDALGLDEPFVLETTLTPSTQTLKVKKKDSLKAGVGPFPSLPLNVNLDIDYSRMSNVIVQFGQDTRVMYIPTDYLVRLYQLVDGDSRKIDPSVAIEIDDQYIVDQVLLANELAVTFESEADFSASLDGKLEAINKLPAAAGKVTLSRETARRIVARVQGPTYYLVAIKVLEWDDLG